MKYVYGSLRKRIISGDVPRWVSRNPRSGYIISVALSTPPWVDVKALHEKYREAKRRSAVTGIPHVVGHLVPVTHPMVCGLTVPWNLKVMSKRENDRMGNRLHLALHGDLFEEPEQLSML